MEYTKKQRALEMMCFSLALNKLKKKILREWGIPVSPITDFFLVSTKLRTEVVSSAILIEAEKASS